MLDTKNSRSTPKLKARQAIGGLLCASLLLSLCWNAGRTVQADALITNVPVGTNPVSVTVNPMTNKVYVTNKDSNNVTEINGINNLPENFAAAPVRFNRRSIPGPIKHTLSIAKAVI